LVEQQAAGELHACPSTLQVPGEPGMGAQLWEAGQVAVQQSELLLHVIPMSKHCCAEHAPLRQRLEQQSVFTVQLVLGPPQ